jgi:hypothetical protein
MKTNLLTFAIFLSHILAWSQELPTGDSINTNFKTVPQKFSINGYVKEMQTLDFSKDFESLNATNLIHNRINFKWKPIENLAFYLELRNRFIWGDDVRNIPGYASLLRNSNESFDLSKVWFSNPSYVLHTNTDRFNVDYKYKGLELRVGRQRINWGISTIWNPNDLFNTYNFLDFDYEERPGSDAVKFTGKISSFSGIELAYTEGNKTSNRVLAGKYFLNTRGYDIQLITGLFGDRYTAGFGWAGSIGDAGFKGETQLFSKTSVEDFQLNFTLESDYAFKSGWYLNGSFLFNNNGIDKKITNPLEVNLNFSPSFLMPTKWNFIIASGKEITPLFSANISALYAPGANLLLLLPSLKYSLSENLNADIVWQSIFVHLNQFNALNHRGYLRLKYNY